MALSKVSYSWLMAWIWSSSFRTWPSAESLALTRVDDWWLKMSERATMMRAERREREVARR